MKIKNLKLKISSSGFTLTEMLLYMGLLSMLIIIMVELFASTLDVQLDSQAISSVDQDSRYILSRFTYDIQRSQTLVVPATPGESTNSLQITIDGINYTYTLINGNLQVTNASSTDNLNSFDTTISNINFQRVGSSSSKPTVKIGITIAGKAIRTSGTESKTFQTAVGLR